MNRLSKENSAYLRHASDQKIDWYPWSDEAFLKAGSEDKPVFLSTGAVWCHWCHVMAKESFEDEDVASILNEKFVCIKLDRDERPDIDRRYQQAVSAMGSGSGWPLSVFLTPDKKPFFGGTYFPPEDSFGRPGFKKILTAVSEFYRTRRSYVNDYSVKVISFLKEKPSVSGKANIKSIDDAVSKIMNEFDPVNGGFGSSPKFPMPGAIGFLMNRYFFTKDELLGNAVKKTLLSMSAGGFYDQLGGGFHRYSVDESWTIPHFEKMADDNAWLLKNYADAYSLFKDARFREIAEGIINFIKEILSDPEGGFYASQDADVSPDDEGGYFLWKDDELRNILDDEEFKVLSLYFLNKQGAMHHDPSKMVIKLWMTQQDMAWKTGLDISRISDIIRTGKSKLLSERQLRVMPFIDKAMYTSINGMLISSLLNAYKILHDTEIRDLAIKSLDKIMLRHYKNGELCHIEGVKALLDDYIHIIDALISAYEVTSLRSYVSLAEEIMNVCIDRLWDSENGGFFDSADSLLDIRIKGIEDMPHPSSNSIAVILLMKLYHITEDEKYKSYADSSLKYFSVKAQELGIHSAYYFIALDASFNMLKLTIQTLPDSELAKSALSVFRPYKSIVFGDDNRCIIPCIGNTCFEPIADPVGLENFIEIKFKN
ncbi:MAG: thioredoxin domain-containing protein [Nitrospirae bacterium]|nr:thioredoxin domain-containing protein [Nitrospirota bacterium]